MKVLIISNIVNNSIPSSLYNLLGAANELMSHNNASCDVIFIGDNISDIIDEVAYLKIINNIIIIDDKNLNNLIAENIAMQLSTIVKEYTHVIMNADALGKNLLPRIAGILDIGQISDVVKILSSNTFCRYMYAGNILVEIQSFYSIQFLTIRANKFNFYNEVTQTKVNIKFLCYQNPINNNISFVNITVHNDEIKLNNAKVIVSGGVSLESKLNFDKLIRTLAKKLNAAVGATRTAVEAGYVSNDAQVGQTGIVVSPNTYIAIGISGAVQHIAGIKDSKTIIAINKDANAPIFEHSNYAFVGDLFEVIPYLIDNII